MRQGEGSIVKHALEWNSQANPKKRSRFRMTSPDKRQKSWRESRCGRGFSCSLCNPGNRLTLSLPLLTMRRLIIPALISNYKLSAVRSSVDRIVTSEAGNRRADFSVMNREITFILSNAFHRQ